MGVSSGSALKNPPEMHELQEMQVQSLGQEDTLEDGMATHFSNSCLNHPMNKEAWWATVHRIAKSRT